MRKNSLTGCMLWVLPLLLLVAGACSRPDSFTVKGTLPGAGKVVLTLVAPTPQRTFETEVAPDGKFAIKGESSGWAMATLQWEGLQEPLTLLVRNGDKLKVEPQDQGFAVAGSKTMKAINRFGSENAEIIASGNSKALNAAVAEYIQIEGPTPAAAFLMLTLYDSVGREDETAELLQPFSDKPEYARLLEPLSQFVGHELAILADATVPTFNMKGLGDSTVRFSPGRYATSLLMFTGKERRLPLSQKVADKTAEWPQSRIRVVELDAESDSAQWKDATKADTLATWSRVLLPAGVASMQFHRLDIPRLPYYIVADSTGRQRYRGADLDAALDTMGIIVAR